ncbi:MAG: flagellar FlbD family protein [Oscillospiraceae bacterium]|nr:flagellar FlbD family protein [Oscillospiraceae bacterium]
MLKVTRLNDVELLINADLVEFIEETPDTVITLTTGKKFVVKESAETLVGRIIHYRREVFTKLPVLVKDEYIEKDG